MGNLPCLMPNPSDNHASTTLSATITPTTPYPPDSRPVGRLPLQSPRSAMRLTEMVVMPLRRRCPGRSRSRMPPWSLECVHESSGPRSSSSGDGNSSVQCRSRLMRRGGDIPYPYCAVAAAGGEPGAGGVERHRPHLAGMAGQHRRGAQGGRWPPYGDTRRCGGGDRNRDSGADQQAPSPEASGCGHQWHAGIRGWASSVFPVLRSLGRVPRRVRRPGRPERGRRSSSPESRCAYWHCFRRWLPGR